ncbi:conserved hypothetical protein [Trichormus variabilis ATCC 29413]|uniref:Uncharacterized protein n=1 Tax=Trichormus variabilis (strain ATCC 29413 / PCC 7937) TaxID=240292 RepID=Q3M8F5_TRIV2|nr:conserved hypothetical protein [Trichormus variabilis ATCC 29413]QFZ12748.1 hypothetical protein EH233_12395 [Anabaena sp. YBS01]QHD82162.1 hypothetical protein GSQ19_21390 [Trichormus variabilis 0441]
MRCVTWAEGVGKADGSVTFLSSVGGSRVIERRGKCKKKCKFLFAISYCQSLFINQTSKFGLPNLQSVAKKNFAKPYFSRDNG